ncbi:MULTISPECIES: glycosyltransferase [unclassified Yoonia]|uniref:glycosyltransferase n=1 Tax=unclassified Yoonia TaxID=2629118 RepID=UPI002B0037AA|nr:MULTISPECIES: glycosyltransferase [unclassified Yoonia]
MNSPLSMLLTRPFRANEFSPAPRPALLCFSHLRWDFVHQRPQHLLNAAAESYRVYFIEEPEFAPLAAHYRMRVATSGVTVLTPVFDALTDHVEQQKILVQGLQRNLGGGPVVHWFYTPMALRFARGLPCDLCVYDCMDELSAFRFAPPDLAALETELLAQSDLVFTGGKSLFAAKRQLHDDVHCFPSSVDTAHFARARTKLADPPDQTDIAQPRIGYVGVIDERIDLDLIATGAAALPHVQFVMIGPIAKIDPADLPQAPNIHWLGSKDYSALPVYMAHWKSAWMPFALNDATKFISPTKTPEYLAAGLPVTATAVADVVETYGRQGLVTIANTDTIATALQASLHPPGPEWQIAVDRCLALMSWSGTWAAMQALMSVRLPIRGKV